MHGFISLLFVDSEYINYHYNFLWFECNFFRARSSCRVFCVQLLLIKLSWIMYFMLYIHRVSEKNTH